MINEKQKEKKYVHENLYVAEIEVDLLESEDSWSPWLSVEDACRLDEVKQALERGDIAEAARYGKIYRLQLVAV
jgi:hypothetical protein